MKVNKEDIIEIIEAAGVIADIEKINAGEALTDAGVDSLDLANVLLGIEERYEIKIPDEDIEKLSTLEGIVKYLIAK